ncbi:UDP-N-acetylbacillosamine transaminase [Nitratifractor salsuginis]|uniref:DegT/DnrJ/EryC1/StrS aminotransferase n=1 Tax=Nitratifractor salsuginis (strain DSM 16511 / JCM 12458 / E9I37-1) TaxID=749222 RepID=E6X2U9_NITSE|nr:UDP-N-acetylbacillosamine transaminase [Nitratifractor salsuginis]ADV47232.1 DegT/DnrJ/EryC1/StrS aminotransferase [Nitratifractor salsuginis DSM 16511]
MSKRLYLSPPHMGGNELRYIQEAFESNYIAPLGAFVDRFEEAVASFSGVKAAAALSSGTAAIHLALRLTGVGEGDRVLASTFTFVGSVAPILYQGAEPVFVDSDKHWNADPKLVEEAILREKPKAFILTHLYGQCAKVDQIAELCEAHGVTLIEDAAESLGATLNGRQSGTFGRFGIYSFNGNKIITTSGGGMLVSDEEEAIAHARKLATQAREPFPWYEHEELGYNYRMSNVLAAIGVGQMEILPERIEEKRQIFEWYREALSDLEGIEWMPEIPGSRGNRWLTTLTLAQGDPMRIIQALEEANIEARLLWKPMHRQPLFAGAKCYGGAVSEELFARGLCLPSGTAMGREDVERVASVLRRELV